MQNKKKQPELADIFRNYGEDYRRSHFLSTEQSKTMHHIEICRTAVLGGLLSVTINNKIPFKSRRLSHRWFIGDSNRK